MGSKGGCYSGVIDFDVVGCKDIEEELLDGSACVVESAAFEIWLIVL